MGDHTWNLILTVAFKLKDYSRSQRVTPSKQAVIYQKEYKKIIVITDHY